MLGNVSRGVLAWGGGGSWAVVGAGTLSAVEPGPLGGDDGDEELGGEWSTMGRLVGGDQPGGGIVSSVNGSGVDLGQGGLGSLVVGGLVVGEREPARSSVACVGPPTSGASWSALSASERAAVFGDGVDVGGIVGVAAVVSIGAGVVNEGADRSVVDAESSALQALTAAMTSAIARVTLGRATATSRARRTPGARGWWCSGTCTVNSTGYLVRPVDGRPGCVQEWGFGGWFTPSVARGKFRR